MNGEYLKYKIFNLDAPVARETLEVLSVVKSRQ